jgi:lysyl-tRNA synthetase class 2
MLAVELDGSQHVQRKYYDDKREAQLSKLGIKVLRFWDNDALVNTSGVLEQILLELETLPAKNPHPDPLPKEREPQKP